MIGVGTVLERSRKADFLKEVETLRGEVVKFAKRVGDTLADRFHDTAKQLAEELRTHVRSQLAPHKYPRWIEFAAELPKTATGKIQRFRLRG